MARTDASLKGSSASGSYGRSAKLTLGGHMEHRHIDGMSYVLFRSAKHPEHVIYADSEARVSELSEHGGPWPSYGDVGDLP